jgi:hypothetical protein
VRNKVGGGQRVEEGAGGRSLRTVYWPALDWPAPPLPSLAAHSHLVAVISARSTTRWE